jgi:protein dithiol oxidoreductase (disulfide-forming)
MLRKTWMLAALALAACGGDGGAGSEQTAAEQTASQPPPAAQALPTQEPSAAAPTAEAAPQTTSAALVDVGAAPTSGRFQLGTHYKRLSPTQPTSANPQQVEVAEVFWYGCPHCFNLDPYLAAWLMRKPEYVSFIRIPAVWNDTLKLHARAFYTADALGKGAEMHEPLFREIHVNRNYLDSEASLRDFFGKFDVSADSFNSTFSSFSVHTKVQRADELNRRYRIASVPTIVVNGKYVTDVSTAGGFEELLDLIDELVAAERAGK